MKKLLLSIVFILFMNFVCRGQIPLTKNRVNYNNTGILQDSAQKSISILPTTSITSIGGKTYETFITNGDIIMEWPKPGQVYQRDNSNKGWVYIKGTSTNPLIDSLLIQTLPIEGGIGKSKAIKRPLNGNFETAIELVGGDYEIRVIEYYSQNKYLTKGVRKSIFRVGVGEVLMVWGHSFVSAVDEDAPNPVVPAQRERSRTIKNVFPGNPFFTNIPGLPFTFMKIEGDLGPFNSYPWSWGIVADSLVDRLNVPVLIYSSAFGGSNIFMNRKNILNEPFGFTWFNYGGQLFQDFGFPYRAVQAVFQQYTPQTGIRGVLVQHGVNDQSTGREAMFRDDYLFVLNTIRNNEANFSNMPFFLAYEDLNFSQINNQIQEILTNPGTYPDFRQGIDLRDISTRGPWRNENGQGHFVGMLGLKKYAELWINAIPNSFFNSSPFKLANIAQNLKN